MKQTAGLLVHGNVAAFICLSLSIATMLAIGSVPFGKMCNEISVVSLHLLGIVRLVGCSRVSWLYLVGGKSKLKRRRPYCAPFGFDKSVEN